MGKQRNITPQVAKSYDDAFEAFNEVVKKGKGNTGFGSLGSSAASTFRGYDTGIGDSKYDKGLSWNANIDEDNVKGSINEFRSEQQGGWAETGAFLGRVGTKVGTELVKTVGAIGGTLVGLAENTQDLITDEDKHTFLETAFNNDFIKAAEKIQKSINNEYLPVYVSEIVENGDFLDKVTSGEFWATEGADGVGYLISALAPGAAFKALGGSAKLFGGAVKSLQYARYGKGIEGARKALTAAGVTIDKIDSIAIPALNTYFEAGAEAKGAGDAMEFKKDKYLSDLKNNPEFQNQVVLKLKELDEQRRAGVITIEEQNQIASTLADDLAEKSFQDQKGKAMRNVFLTNVGILALPNYIQAKMLFGKTPSRLLLDKITGEVAEKSIKNTAKQGLKNVGKSFLTEGSEEVAQTSTEQRNVRKGLNNQLSDTYAQDIDPLTFGDDFIKTLGTTEGQMAGFLGGIMGGPMSAVGGYFQDKSDRVQTERLREKINGASTAYADIKNTNIYEQEEYTNSETGEVDFRDKEVDGKKVFIPENVAKVKKALDLIEKDSNEYDNAVEDGDVEKIEEFRNRGEFNVIANFIGEDEVTLDALHEHLKVAFPTETSKDVSDEQVKINKTNLERIDKIMTKARHLQKDFVSFKDMSASIIRINNPAITENSTKEEKKAANEHLEDFLNRVGNTFLSERAEEYEAKQTLNKLEKQRLELENNSTIIEIDNPNYIEGISSELDKKTKTRSNNPRLELVNSLIDKVKEKLKGYEENTNSNIWNNELLNKQFTAEVELRKQIKEDNSPEQVAKNDEVNDIVGNALENATSVEDVDNAVNLTTGEHLENKITTNVEKIEDLEDKENSLKDELLNIESELSEVINTNNFNLKDELDKVYQDLLIELKENRDELLQQSENLKQLKEQKQLEETNRLKKLKEKNKLEEKKRQDLSKQNKKIEEESKKIKLLEKKILLIQNIGNVVKVNGVTGILNKVNDSIFEIENENEIFEINLENLENLEIEKVKSLKERYNISKISETSVTVNNVEYKINVDNLGNIISLSPKNNSSQKIKNNDLLIVVEIERNKQDFNKRIPVRNIDQRLKDNNYENIANILNTIYNYNLTDTVQSALNNLYSEKELTEQEKLQLGLWVQDAFDRLSNLFNSKNTNLENETLLNSYDNLEIILSLLYGRELKTTTKEFKNDKSNDIGKTEVDVTSERTSRQIESEKQTSKNSEIEKLNKEIEDLKSKITDLNSGTEKIIENYKTSLKKTETTFISEANPIITEKLQVQAEAKKAEIIQAEKIVNETQIAEATQEDNDFNDTTTYSDLIDTEGSPVTDELIPKEGDNNTPEELEKVKNEEESAGKGAQIISTYRNDDKKGRWKSGDIIPFMKEQFSNFLKYEKEPIDKSGKFVTFEVNNNPGPNENVNEALNLYKEFLKRGFTNMTIDEYTLLYEYLPINVRFTPEVNAPIETKRIATFDKETNEWVEKMNISTGLLRTELINNLRNGISFENMSTTIQDQYKGVLKIDSDTAENNLLQLDGVKDLKYIRDNLFVVNSQGNLQNILTSKIENFTNGKIKPNAAGEIYLMIPQANGKPFPLKLNIKKISESEAVLLYYIYREILLNDKALDTTVSQVNDELNALIKNTFKAELDIIGGNEDDIKLQTIIDLLIYQSDNIKSRMQIDKDADGNTVLLYSNGQDGKVATKETIEEDLGAIIDYLENHKRHQIKINPKFATDNTKTNLKSNSADYLKYLIDNNILSTNAVVNEPTFQGYTNIYLNTGVIVNNQTQPTEKVAEVSPEVADIERRKQDFIKTSIERKGSKLNELEIKAIEDKFNVELQALGQQSTTSNQSEIEAKKADIERRRQEELKSEERRTAESIHEVEFEDGNGDMTKAKVIFYKDGNGKIIQYDVDGERVPGEIKINKELREITKDNPEEIVNRALGENAKTISSQTENIDNAIVNKINAKYDSELKTLENKSENVRNSQENFVSLSEIPGTVENTELKETQEKVIKKQRSPKERQTDFRRMDALFKKKSEKGLTTEKELRDFEMFKEMYPQEFEKRCK